MHNIPERLSAMTHPMVKEFYLKKDYIAGKPSMSVLVIKPINDNYDFVSLLGDLQDLQSQAEKQLGPIDRVDITVH
jgi:hypothetical protein